MPIPRRSLTVGAAAAALTLGVARPILAQAVPAPSGQRAVVWNRVPTAQPVAFITIDDGYYTDLQAIAYVEAQRLPATLFLSVNAPAVFEQPAYFRRYQAVGRNTIQSHGAPHDDMRGWSYEAQYTQLLHAATEIERIYDARPLAFRPPYGQYDDTTLQAAYDTGTRWLVRWSHALWNGALRLSLIHI